MSDQDKSKEELIAELVALRRQVAAQDSVPHLRRATALCEWAPLGIHECDTEGRITFVNPSHEKITGFAADELVGAYVWDRIPAGPQKDSLPAYFRYLAAEQPAPTPFFAKNVRKNGEVFDVRVDWNYLRDLNGHLVGFVSIVSDVTDLKLAQEALQESERRLLTLMSHLPGMAYRRRNDLNWSMEFVSAGVLELTGYPASDFLNGNTVAFGDLIHADDLDLLWVQTQEALTACQPYQFEYRIRTAAGEERWVWEQGSGVCCDDGEVQALEGFITDITRHKQAEMNLQEANDFNKRLIAFMYDGLSVLDTDGVHVEVNDAFCRMTGFTRDELIGVGPPHPYWPPECREYIAQTIQEVARGEAHQYEFTFMRKNGERFPVILAPSRTTNRDGSVVNYFATIKDISERKEIEDRLRESERRLTTDIAARKEAELELSNARAELERRVAERTAELSRANEELRIFKTFAQTSGEGFGMVDLEGRIVYANASLARLVGEDDPENARGKHPSVYCSENYQELLETNILPVLEEGGVWRGELTMVSVTGGTIPVLQTSFTLLDDSQKPIRRGVVITDLRKVKEAEESLQNSLKELEAVYGGLPEGLVLVELPSREFRRVNPAICTMLKYSQDELLSMTVDQIHPPESLAQIDEAAAQLLDGKPVSMKAVPMLRGDGSVFYAAASATTIHIEGKPYSVGFFRDITEQLEAEEERRKSEARYRALVESSPDAIVMCDLDGQITFASPQAIERHRVKDASDLVGRLSTDLVVEQDRGLIQENIRRLLDSGLRRNDQYVGLRMDGTTFFAEVSAAVIKNAVGEPESLVAVYRDITERKEAQASLYRMLQASDRERELITYEIHDGVAQQLVGALMHFEAILLSGGEITSAAMPRFQAGLAALKSASAETRSLMNRMRTPVLQKFGVRAAIADFIDQFFDPEAAPKINYRCAARFGRLEPVLENTIFRVAQEAITNARNHSQATSVQVSLVQRDDEVTVVVQDDGVGFDPSNVKENRFGLHGIRERVRLVGKQLTIDTEPGKGTRIEATFPLIYRMGD